MMNDFGRNTPVQKQTHTLNHAVGTVVVDVWEPPHAPYPNILPNILLVHGWGGSGGYLQSTAAALAQFSRVYVPDLPGTGRSQPVKCAQDMYAQVDVLSDIIDYFELTTFDVIGHSMGGVMALMLADAHPQRVKRVVVSSISFFVSEEQKKTYQAVLQGLRVAMKLRSARMAKSNFFLRSLAKRFFYRVPTDMELLRKGYLEYVTLDATTAIRSAENASDPAIPAAGARITAPTLLLVGRQDDVISTENVEFTQGLISNCQVHWFERCGHMPMIEYPDEFMALVTDFLALKQTEVLA